MTYKDFSSRLKENSEFISAFLKGAESAGLITRDSRFILDYLYSMFVDSWYYFVKSD